MRYECVNILELQVGVISGLYTLDLGFFVSYGGVYQSNMLPLERSALHVKGAYKSEIWLSRKEELFIKFPREK